MSPRASILLPFRDAEGTLGEALDSVLAEEGDHELLAIDDGSSDGSRTIAEARARVDPRLRVIATPPRGLVAALNRGSEEARAPILVRMDADDVHRAPRIGACVAALEAEPRLGLLGTRVALLASAPVGEGLARYVDWQNQLLDEDAHAREVFVESPLCHPTFALRTETLRALGGYREGPFPEDYDLVLRVHAAGLGLRKLPLHGLDWRHASGRLTFRDPRYSVDAFRALKVAHLAPILAQAARPIVLWGAGRDGRRFLRALHAAGIAVDSVIDIDPRKIGRTLGGRPIRGMDTLSSPAEAFVLACVGTRGARELIRAELVRRGWREIEDFRCVA